MSERSASILTKKQRRRIRNGFADLSGQQQRRDRQRVRTRVRAGVLDFETLCDYPDRQLELAFDDVPEEELTAALADATVFLRRVGALEDVDRSAVASQARSRVEDIAEREDSPQSLEAVDLRTPAEIRSATRESMRDELSANPWDRRANGLLKAAGSASIPLLVVLVADGILSQNLLATSTALVTFVFLLATVAAVSTAGVFSIKAAQALKHDVVPRVEQFAEDPTDAPRRVVRWLHRPVERVRRVWDDL